MPLYYLLDLWTMARAWEFQTSLRCPSRLSQTVPDTRDGRLGRARRLIANNQSPGLPNLSAGQRLKSHAKKARKKHTKGPAHCSRARNTRACAPFAPRA